VLDHHEVQLGVLVFRRQGEVGRVPPDHLVLGPGEGDRLGAVRVAALAEVDLPDALDTRLVMGGAGPLVALAEVGFVLDLDPTASYPRRLSG